MEDFSKHLAFILDDGTQFGFGMIGGLVIIHLLSSILRYYSMFFLNLYLELILHIPALKHS